MSLAALLVLCSGQTQPPNAHASINGLKLPDLLMFAKKDPRIEQVARALCRLNGVDPDRVGFPFPDGPLWEYYIHEAMKFIAEDDAMEEMHRAK